MGIFDFLLPRKSSASPMPSKGGAKIKKGQAKSSGSLQQKKKPSVNNSEQRKAGVSKIPVLQRFDDIPPYRSNLTSHDGEILLSSGGRANYVALDSTEKDTCIIISSVEAASESGVDNNLAGLRQKCRARGATTIKSFHAPRSLIALIYEKTSTSISLEDELRQREGYQKDFDNLLRRAISEGVSDIHLEVRRDSAIVRFRKNGLLVFVYDWAVSYARDMAGVIYQVIAAEKEEIFIESKQQAAIIDREIDSVRTRLRLNTMPAYPNGFDVVMRVLRMGAVSNNLTISDLGYSREQVHDIYVSVSRPSGVTIIAGTTGSGKSTSLSTMIKLRIAANSDESGCRIKVITVEDPPEVEILGTTQYPVVRTRTQQDKNPFSAAIQAAMRCDPDILMVGEVRDQDSAELLVHAVQSGHQAFTTIHAPSAIGIIGRLRSLGVKNDVLGSNDFISGLVYQTLLPVACKHCSIGMSDYFESHKEEVDLEFKSRLLRIAGERSLSDVRFSQTSGCKHCEKGVSGRTVVAEVIIPDHHINSLFSQGRDTDAWHHYRKQGGKTALSSGIDKMLAGLCDPRDVEQKLGMVTSDLVMDDGVFNYETERVEMGFRQTEESNDKVNASKEENSTSVETKEDELKENEEQSEFDHSEAESNLFKDNHSEGEIMQINLWKTKLKNDDDSLTDTTEE